MSFPIVPYVPVTLTQLPLKTTQHCLHHTVFPDLEDSSSPPQSTPAFFLPSLLSHLTHSLEPYQLAWSLSSVSVTHEVLFVQMPTALCVSCNISLTLSYSADVCELILVFLLDCVILDIRDFFLLFFVPYMYFVLIHLFFHSVHCVLKLRA